MVETDREERRASLARIVAQAPGALLGGVLGLVLPDGGGDLLAAVSGTTLSQIGADVAERALSPRQENRVAAVFLYAAGAITARQQLGEHLRTDDFFDGERSNGAEFTEGVLLAAKEAYEERKIPYLGNLLANVAFNSDIDAATAHLALRVAEELSWAELCILGVFLDPGRYPMPPHETAAPDNWSPWSVIHSFNSMREGPSALITNKRTTGARGEPRYDLNLNGIEVTSRGSLVGVLMQLEDIPDSDRRVTYEVLTAPSMARP